MRREAYLARILINDLISRIEESKKQINNPNKEIADYHKNEIIKNREKIFEQQRFLYDYERKRKVSRILLFSAAFFFLVLLGFFLFRPGSVVLQVEPSYNLSEEIKGIVSITLESGDSVQKNSEIKLTLLKDSSILAEASKSIEEFLGDQINYVEINKESVSCINDSTQENCTTSSSIDYYYETSGTYSRNISEFINYNISETGDYVLRLEVLSLGVSEEVIFSVSGSGIGGIKEKKSLTASIDTAKPDIKFVIASQCTLSGNVYNYDFSYAVYGTNVSCSNLATGQNYTTTTGEFGEDYFYACVMSCLTFGEDGDNINVMASDSLFFGTASSTMVATNVTQDVVMDTLFIPSVQIIYPVNGINYNVNVSELNFSVTSASLDSCWYSTDGGATNITTSCTENITGLTSNEGYNTWLVAAKDTMENENSTITTFFKDTINPDINFTNPTEISGTTLTTRNNILVNVSVNDSNFANVTIFLYNSTGLYNSTTSTTSPLFLNFTNLVNGIYYFNATAFDSLGNKNSTETRNVTITYDVTPPFVQILYPVNGTTYTSNVTTLNFTATDLNLQTCWYSTDGGINNYTTSCTTNITGLNSTEGSNTWLVAANDTAGNKNSTIVTFFVQGAPRIISVTNISNVNLNEGPSSTSIIVNFSVFDPNGAGDLNDSSAMVNFTRSGEAVRSNLTCAEISSAGNYANYTCNVYMFWFDAAGSWDVKAFIKDSYNNSAINDTTAFSVNALFAFTATPLSLTWDLLNRGSANQTSNNDPMVLNNTGNQDISSGNIRINATNLLGESDSSKAIYAGNFSIGNSTGAENPECGASLMNTSVFTNVTGAVLLRGNFTNNDGTAQEQLYFCITNVGSELIAQPYSTASQGAWTIKIFVVGLVFARKRKKKKRSDEIVSELLSIKEELTKDYSSKNAKLIDSIVEELREKEAKEEINVPIDVFIGGVGALEALCKYMKENLGMRYHEIAVELSRDDRTIWTACSKASEKAKEPIKISKGEILLPLSIFKDRKLTVLEALIVYLKSKGMRYNKIGSLVHRDQRNIWTIYSRAVKKVEQNIS